MRPHHQGGHHGHQHTGHHHREFGRQRRRLFEAGDFQILLMSLLAEAPRHGYELIRLIEQMFGGVYAPSPGIIYPTLTLLEEQEYAVVQTTDGEVRKRYAITAAGRLWLDLQADALSGIRARIAIDARAMNGSQFPESIRQAIRTLKHALEINQGAWPEPRTQRVLKAIEAAIAEIGIA